MATGRQEAVAAGDVDALVDALISAQQPTLPSETPPPLREAVDEEMERDGSVFVIGEEVAQYQGAFRARAGAQQASGAVRREEPPLTAPASFHLPLPRPQAPTR